MNWNTEFFTALTIYKSDGSARVIGHDFRGDIPKEFYYKDGPNKEIKVVKVAIGRNNLDDLSDGILKQGCNIITSSKNPTMLKITVQQSNIIGYISKIHFHYAKAKDCFDREEIYQKPDGDMVNIEISVISIDYLPWKLLGD